MTFELRILFFGKFKEHYVIEEINPENRFLKWILIIGIQYIISLGIILFLSTFYSYQEFLYLMIFLISISIIGLLSTILIFNKIFPNIPELKTLPKTESKYMIGVKSTYFSRHPWISIFLLITLYFGTIYLLKFLFQSLLHPSWSHYYLFEPYQIELTIKKLLVLILYNLSSIVLLIIIIPKVIKLPYGKQPIRQYLVSIKARWPKPLSKYFIWGALVSISILSFGISMCLIFDEELGFLSWDIFLIGLFFSNIIWQEVFFRGIILTILLEISNHRKAIFLDTLLFFMFSLVSLYFLGYDPFVLVISAIFFFLGYLFAYLSFKANSILPGILAQFILHLMGIPTTMVIYFIYF